VVSSAAAVSVASACWRHGLHSRWLSPCIRTLASVAGAWAQLSHRRVDAGPGSTLSTGWSPIGWGSWLNGAQGGWAGGGQGARAAGKWFAGVGGMGEDARVRFSINVPNFGDFADARTVARLAAAAEEAGWDGLFVWDHVVHSKVRRQG